MKLTRLAIVTAALGLTLLACKTITEELPEKSSQNPTGPGAPVVVVPIALPSPTAPSPAPSPNPAPTTNPGPTPTPTPPPPSAQACSLPPSSNPDQCPRTSPVFQAEVESAVNRLRRERPEIFSSDGNSVRNVDAYYEGIIANLSQRGFCGHHDKSDSGAHELGVKNTNAFNEQWSLMVSSGAVRLGSGAYRATCRPAAF